jgi:flagellar capping protein FliD
MGGNKMTGLVSGLDTTALVKAMTANTLAKIQKRQAASQKLTWQQESYQNVISQLSDFQNKYLKASSADSLRLRSNLQKMGAVASSDLVTASAASSAASGIYTINKAQAAKAATITSGGNISTGDVQLDFSKASNDALTYKATVTLDGNKKEISFNGSSDAKTAAANFQSAVDTAFSSVLKGGNKLVMDTDTSVMSFENNAGDGIAHTFTVGYGDAVGLSDDASNRATTNSTLGSISFAKGLDSSAIYRINVNGKDLEFSKDTTIGGVISAINGADAGATASFNALSGEFSIKSSTTGSGSDVEIYQTNGNLLNALFNVDNTTLTSDSASISDKKLTYDTYDSVSAAFNTDMIEDIGKDGIKSGDKTYQLNLSIDGKDYTVNLDSTAFPENSKGYTYAQFDKEIKRQLGEQYLSKTPGATDADKLAFLNNISVETDTGSKQVTFKSSKHSIELKDSGTSWVLGAEKKNWKTFNRTDAMSPFMDPAGTTTPYGSSVKEMTFTNGTTEIKIKGTGEGGQVTLKDLTTADAEGDGPLFTYTESGYLVSNLDGYTAVDDSAKELMSRYFGGEAATLRSPGKANILNEATAGAAYTEGSDALLSITDPSGVSITYQNAENSINVSGLTVNVENLRDFDAARDGGAITVNVTKDTGAVKDLVKSFITDYNELVKTINDIINEDRPKSGKNYYEPLTDEQKEEMDQDEIDKWEDAAKKGLLKNDSDLRRVLDDLNNAMLTVNDGFTIFDLGVTLDDSRTNGNLYQVDETKLDAAINKYGDKIADFFTDATSGLTTKMNANFDKMIKSSGSNYGYLTAKSGAKGTASITNNTIYNQIKDYSDLIKTLQERYDKETERYWSQFTRLETYMSQMNTHAGIFATA